jgi:hypothetical protein
VLQLARAGRHHAICCRTQTRPAVFICGTTPSLADVIATIFFQSRVQPRAREPGVLIEVMKRTQGDEKKSQTGVTVV